MFEQNNNAGRKMTTSIIGGMIYGFAFWLLLDGIFYTRTFLNDKHYVQVKFHWVIPFIISTMAILFMNCFTAEDFRGQGISTVNTQRARICFVLSIITYVVGITLSLVIGVRNYFEVAAVNDYAGVALLMSNFVCLLAGVVVRFGHW